MVKTPKTRHSKSHREPVTIELEPGAVSRVEEANASMDSGAENVAATVGDEAVAEAPTEAAASEAKDEAAPVYDYSFENIKPANEPKAEAKASAPSSAAGNGSRASIPAPKSAPARQPTSGLLPGLAGGLAALVIAGGLQYAGILGAPSSGADDSGQTQAEIASLRSQIADLAAARNGGDDAGRMEGLSSEIAQMKSEVEALKSAGSKAGAPEALAGLDQRIKDVEAAVTSLGQGGGAAGEIAALTDKVGALDTALKAAGETATADDGKIASLEQSVSQLTSKVDAQASQPKIALAIAASALKSAVDRGGAFKAELETFAAISPEAPELATLRAHAEKGVATRADIVAETDAAANAMIAAAKPVNPDAGIVERLVSSAESLVKVRPIGAVEGPGVPETVARMEFAVSQGDLAKALAEYETLPEPAKAAGAEFAAKLKARQEVEALVDQLVAGAMKA